VVYLASHVKGRVVIKTFNKMNLGVLYDIGHLRMEEAILHKSDHPNIPKGICTYIHEGNAMMAMEFTADTTLADWLNTTWFQDVNNQRFFARQMISVLKYLHGLDILHNDIKPANIIMAKDGTIKLIDYGLARYAPGGMVGVLGTTVFMSPEKLHISHFNNGSDWYSFGLILYMMIAGKHPFSDVATRKELLIAVKGSLKPLPFPVANQFVGMFLHPDPIKRWCFANSNLDEMEHHYFWGLTKSAL
jgi:serine/threonine protein kinase